MKSTITIKNKTEYYSPEITRQFIEVSNPSLQKAKKQKQEGYETRLYYEFEDCKKKGGFSQFITLTFNNKSIPTFYGVPCLDNSLIRELFHDNSRFFKDLKKKRGYTFKYFVGAEFGEGGKSHNYEGVRGEGNNPHYHIITFFTPLSDWEYVDKTTGEYFDTPYLEPKEVCDAIKAYWQGDTDNCQEYRYGIVSFGSVHQYGVIKDFKAISYTSKYCVKDAYFHQAEQRLKNITYYKLCKKYDTLPHSDDTPLSKEDYIKVEQDKIIKEFRSKHSLRVLCSHGLGISALNEIENPMEPKLKIATKKGFKMRTIPMYLYRKLFYTIEKDKDGKYFYKLNKLGKEYKLYRLPKDLEDMTKTTRDNLKFMLDNPNILKAYLNSEDCYAMCPYASMDTETNEVTITEYSFNALKNLYERFSDINSDNNIIYKHSLYEKIYKNRFFKYTPFGDAPMLEPIRDYRKSLSNTHKPIYKHNSDMEAYYYSNLSSYSEHPYFCDDICLFDWFSDINSYMVVQKDKEDRRKYEEWKRLKNIQNNLKFKVA